MTFSDFVSVLLLYTHDSAEAWQRHDARPSDQGLRRNFVRASFAHFEGAVWLMKELCLELQTDKWFQTNEPEIFSFLKEAPADGPDGPVKFKFLPMRANAKKVFKVFGQLTGRFPDLSKLMNIMGPAVEIRDRITHPKSLKLFDVLEKEMQICRDFQDAHVDVFIEVIKVLGDIVKCAGELQSHYGGALPDGLLQIHLTRKKLCDPPPWFFQT